MFVNFMYLYLLLQVVVSSPLFISTNISKPILVSASTVSAISDVTM